MTSTIKQIPIAAMNKVYNLFVGSMVKMEAAT